MIDHAELTAHQLVIVVHEAKHFPHSVLILVHKILVLDVFKWIFIVLDYCGARARLDVHGASFHLRRHVIVAQWRILVGRLIRVDVLKVVYFGAEEETFRVSNDFFENGALVVAKRLFRLLAE